MKAKILKEINDQAGESGQIYYCGQTVYLLCDDAGNIIMGEYDNKPAAYIIIDEDTVFPVCFDEYQIIK